jgi:PAS domain S-box-containing protein
MNIHRKLIILVGLGMLLVLAVSVLSLMQITASFSRSTRSVGAISLEVRKIWSMEQKIDDAGRMVEEYVRTGDPYFRKNFETFHASIVQMLADMKAYGLPDREGKVMIAIESDFHALEAKVARIFELRLADRKDQDRAVMLLSDLESLLAWLRHDIERYKEEGTRRLDETVKDLHGTQVRIAILYGVVVVTVIGFLVALGGYLYRKISMPLAQLWQGTEEISRGNLDYQMQVRGETDIVQLAGRFNEMAQKLKESYTDLERRLLERTQQLGALNSVALMLGKSGILHDMLQRSLETILANFPEMDPQGGIFLCDARGEGLHLVAHQGLAPDFVVREARIRMGECLCGTVAQTGEMVFSEDGCRDPRHSRRGESGHSHIVAPIKSRGIVLGVMFLYPTKKFSLKPSDVQMFDTIGAQLGMAVENLRLYAEVKESSVKYWDLFEKSRDILFTTDMEGKLTAANEAMEKFMGRPRADLIGSNVLELFTEEGKKVARSILTGECPLADRTFEFEVPRPGESPSFLEISGRCIFTMNKPYGFQMAARDVTEQKNLRELLVQAERLSAIGQIGIAVRHEINNPLTTVIGNTELLLERLENADGELKKRLEIILNNALRIAEIVKRLQEIRKDRTVEYVPGTKMTDLGKG